MPRWPAEIPIDEELLRRLTDSAAHDAFATRAETLGLSDELDGALRCIYAPLAAWLEEQRRGRKRSLEVPMVAGISGAQGSGKSTVSDLLAALLREAVGLNVALLSIDDLYLTRRQRTQLARQVHPLLITRGVPGTHDVGLGRAVLRQLDLAGEADRVPLPSFDKSTDDRRPRADWPRHLGRPDIILFEGWCVGMRAQSEAALRLPVNDLERDSDEDGSWRRYVNDQLRTTYADLFARLDLLVLLRVPDMRSVFEWRGLQERALIARVGRTAQTMSPAQIRRFVMHYERLTRHALMEMPARADLQLRIGADHQIAAVQGRG